MRLDFMAFAIPFFLFFMGLEYYLSVKWNQKVHQFHESIANINVGIAERLSDLLTTGSFYFVFSWIHERYAFFEIKPGAITWLLLFLATDFVWYWYHRLGHQVNILWAAHIVHHQSDDFNYTAAARITVLQAVARGLFWSVLPLLGFPPKMIVVLLLIHGTYPFFTHTQLIGKLGWLEYIIVTPSHHRVHHSSNPEYLDKNYGDMLIIWDKIFGTFAPETTEPIYGLTKSLNSQSFLWQHFHYFLELGLAFRMAPSVRDKIQVVFGSPAEFDPRMRMILERKLSQKVHTSYSARLKRTIQLKTASTIAVTFATVLFSKYFQANQLALISIYILLSLIVTGAMLEQKRWIFHLEFIRLGIFLLGLSTMNQALYVTSALSILFLGILLFYKTAQRKYQAFLFSC
ncbi:MAG: sterol desaturase family protein [Bacteroidetes bacterium]|nr:sterol desaturase family protein [Bacteroidota bacterium]